MRSSTQKSESLFSDRLRGLRARLGITQKRLAELLDVNKNYVYMLEKGRLPGRKIIEKVSRLEVDKVPSLTTTGTVNDEKSAPSPVGEIRAKDGVSKVLLSLIQHMETEWLEQAQLACEAAEDIPVMKVIAKELARRRKGTPEGSQG